MLSGSISTLSPQLGNVRHAGSGRFVLGTLVFVEVEPRTA
jgi:hypothetical protein